MICKMKKSSANGYPPITWWVGMIFLIIITCSCGSSPSPTAVLFTPTLPTPTVFTPTLVVTPSVAPTHTSTATASPTSTWTQVPPTKGPSPTPTVEPLDPFPVLKPGQYLLYIHEPLPDASMNSPAKPQSKLTIISLDGQRKAVWDLPPGWTEGRSRISPDRKTLAFIGSNFAALVDLESGAIRYLYACNCFGSDSVAWSPDGKYLAASNGDGISLISLADGKVTEMSMDCLDACWNIQWSPDGKWLSYGEGDFMAPSRSGVFLISTDCLDQPETCFKQKRGPLAPNSGASMGFPGWSPDGKYLAAPLQSSGDNLALDFISVQTGKAERRMEIPNTHAMHIDAIAWSPDGEWIEYVQQTRGIYLT